MSDFENKQKKILGTIEELVKQLGTLKPPVERPEDQELVMDTDGSYYFRNKGETRSPITVDEKPRHVILPQGVRDEYGKEPEHKQKSFFQQNKKLVFVSIGAIVLGLVVLWLFS